MNRDQLPSPGKPDDAQVVEAEPIVGYRLAIKPSFVKTMVVMSWVIPLLVVPCLILLIMPLPEFEAARWSLVGYGVALIAAFVFAIVGICHRRSVPGAIAHAVVGMVLCLLGSCVLLLVGSTLYLLPDIRRAIEEEKQRQIIELRSGGIPTAVPGYEPPPMQSSIALEVEEATFDTSNRWISKRSTLHGTEMHESAGATFTQLRMGPFRERVRSVEVGCNPREVLLLNDSSGYQPETLNLGTGKSTPFGPTDAVCIVRCSEGIALVRDGGSLVVYDPQDLTVGRQMRVPEAERHRLAGSYKTGEDRLRATWAFASPAAPLVIIQQWKPKAWWVFDVKQGKLVAHTTKKRLDNLLGCVLSPLQIGHDGKSLITGAGNRLVRLEMRGHSFQPVEIGPAHPLHPRDGRVKPGFMFSTPSGWRMIVSRGLSPEAIDAGETRHIIVDPYDLAAPAQSLPELQCPRGATVDDPRGLFIVCDEHFSRDKEELIVYSTARMQVEATIPLPDAQYHGACHMEPLPCGSLLMIWGRKMYLIDLPETKEDVSR